VRNGSTPAGATGRKPHVLCVILLGSCAASAPMIEALLDLRRIGASSNVFRVAGDMLHNFACVFLTTKVLSQRSVAGLSWHTVVLYALVFSTRYLDLVTMWWVPVDEGESIWDYVSVYNTVLKLLYLSTSYTLIALFFVFRETYDPEADQFCKMIVIVPSLLLAIAFNYQPEWSEVLWTFSIYLEVTAMVPQLLLFRAYPCPRCYDFFACRTRLSPHGCRVSEALGVSQKHRSPRPTDKHAPRHPVQLTTAPRPAPARAAAGQVRPLCLPAPTGAPTPGRVATAAGPLPIDGLLWFYVLCAWLGRRFFCPEDCSLISPTGWQGSKGVEAGPPSLISLFPLHPTGVSASVCWTAVGACLAGPAPR
jgi:hypothetical protein